MSIADLRKEYKLGVLRRQDMNPDPIAQFNSWFEAAAGSRPGGRIRKFFVGFYKSLQMLAGAKPPDVTAMTLATADKSGKPSARIVLLKGVDQRGFIFFTNYDSRKGHELTENSQAALAFYWPDLERQICIAGSVTKVPEAESDAYFQTRPRGSRLATWVSRQSQIVHDRAELQQRWKELEARYSKDAVPRPPYWGGYVLSPQRIEFWQGRPSRLHDRIQYTRQSDNQWTIDRLAP